MLAGVTVVGRGSRRADAPDVSPMANPSAPMPSRTAELHRSLLAYLTRLGEAEGAEEGMEVAVQCLSMLDGFVDPSLSAAPAQRDLLQVFEAGIAALNAKQRQPTTTQTRATGEPSIEAAQALPPAFDRFLESLERRGYFSGAEKGSPAYERRVAEARSKFNAKFGAAPANDARSIARAARAELCRGDAEGAIREASRLIDGGSGAAAESAEGEDGSAGGCRLADALGTRSLALLHKGKLEDALADAETAVALAASAPQSARAVALARLGLACEAVGETSRACESYVQALEAHEAAAVGAGGEMGGEAGGEAGGSTLLTDTRVRALAVSGLAGAASSGSSNSTRQMAAPTQLTLAPAAGGSGSGALAAAPVDLAQLSAFLSDPTVLATAERVADNFLSGSPGALDDVRESLASLFGGDGHPQHPALCGPTPGSTACGGGGSSSGAGGACSGGSGSGGGSGGGGGGGPIQSACVDAAAASSSPPAPAGGPSAAPSAGSTRRGKDRAS